MHTECLYKGKKVFIEQDTMNPIWMMSLSVECNRME